MWMTCGHRKAQEPVPGSGRPVGPAACTGVQLRWPDPENSSGALLPVKRREVTHPEQPAWQTLTLEISHHSRTNTGLPLGK